MMNELKRLINAVCRGVDAYCEYVKAVTAEHNAFYETQHAVCKEAKEHAEKMRQQMEDISTITVPENHPAEEYVAPDPAPEPPKETVEKEAWELAGHKHERAYIKHELDKLGIEYNNKWQTKRLKAFFEDLQNNAAEVISSIRPEPEPEAAVEVETTEVPIETVSPAPTPEKFVPKICKDCVYNVDRCGRGALWDGTEYASCPSKEVKEVEDEGIGIEDVRSWLLKVRGAVGADGQVDAIRRGDMLTILQQTTGVNTVSAVKADYYEDVVKACQEYVKNKGEL